MIYSNNSHWKPFNIAISVSILFLIAFFALSALGFIQSSESQSLIGDASRWCERVAGGLFREPINTLSNLGFMVVGLFIFFIITSDDKDDNKNYFTGLTCFSILYYF